MALNQEDFKSEAAFADCAQSTMSETIHDYPIMSKMEERAAGADNKSFLNPPHNHINPASQRGNSYLRNLPQKDRDEALIKAAQEGQTRRLELLIHADANLDHQDKFGWSAIQSAADKGFVECVKLLIDNGADVNSQSQIGSTALHVASERGDTEIVELLVQNGAKKKHLCTPLHSAVSKGDLATIQFLLDEGALVNEQCSIGRAPLHSAALYCPSTVAVEKLLASGADINLQNAVGSTAILLAAWRGNKEIVEYLISRGAEVDIPNKAGKTAFCQASCIGSIETVELLYKQGADINVCDKLNYTVLLLTSITGELDTVKFLVSHGANLEAKGPYGITPLIGAVIQGHHRIVEFLLQSGADVNAVCDVGYTALHWAADRRNELGIPRLLVEHGANLSVGKGKIGTPEKIANVKKHALVEDFLKSRFCIIQSEEKKPLKKRWWSRK